MKKKVAESSRLQKNQISFLSIADSFKRLKTNHICNFQKMFCKDVK